MNIIHLADLHIGSGISPILFAEAINQVVSYGQQLGGNALIIIAGDVFHHKTHYSGSDVECFNSIIKRLADLKVPIIIIPGNHDSNLNCPEICDLISPMNLPPCVQYWKESGHKAICGIKFFHVSVFDTSDSEAIEKALESDEILLYHGPVNGAIFGQHKVHESRITRRILEKAKCAILGDIHEHQFIGPRVAYSGSLIQQNLAESTNKGFVVWHIGAAVINTIFIKLNCDAGFIRVDLRGKTPQETDQIIAGIILPKMVKKISLLTDADDGLCDQQIAKVKGKLGKIDHVSRVTGKSATFDTDISSVLLTSLTKNGATPEQSKEIIQRYTERMISYKYKKWHVEKVYFDNMFKYGENNCIDFTKFEGGVSGIIAANRAGKSSVIDILVYALFGKCIRGDIASILHTRDGQTKATKFRVCVYFNSGDQNYRIERRGNARKVHVVLFQGDQNISASDIEKTNALMKTLVGTLSQFLATGLYYDSTCDIIRMEKKTRLVELRNIFGLVDDNQLYTILMKQRLEVSKKLLAVEKPKNADPRAQLEATRVAIAGETQKGAEEGAALTKMLGELDSAAQVVAQLCDIGEVKKLYGDTYNECEATSAKIDELKAKITRIVPFAVKVGPPTEEAKIMAQSVGDCASIARKLNDLRGRVSPNTRGMKAGKIIQSKPQLEAKLETVDRRRTVLIGLTSESPINNIQDNLTKVGTELNSIKLVQVSGNLVEHLQGEVAKLRAGTNLSFDAKCGACIGNKKHLVCNLMETECKLEHAIKDAKEANEANEKAIGRRNELIALQVKLVEQITLARELADLTRQAGDLRENINYLTQHADELAEIVVLEEQFEAAKRAESARKHVEDYDNWVQYNYSLERRKLQDKLAAHVGLCTKYKAQIEYNEVNSGAKALLAELRAKYPALLASRAQTLAHIESLSREMVALEADIVTFDNYAKLAPEYTKEIDLLDLYIKCLGNAEFTTSILAVSMQKVIKMANEILAMICDFELAANVHSTHIEFHIMEANKHKLPVCMGSSFQKFIVSLAFRFALTGILPSSPNFVMIDEGFGCMDKSNVAKLVDIFAGVKYMYKFFFIISHIDLLQNILDFPITITEVEGSSYIHCGGLGACPPLALEEGKKTIVTTGSPANGAIVCICGRTLKKGLTEKHKASKKHQRAVRAKVGDLAGIEITK
jgi:DNA repair exonuclease SbcCD ATPase subunit